MDENCSHHAQVDLPGVGIFQKGLCNMKQLRKGHIRSNQWSCAVHLKPVVHFEFHLCNVMTFENCSRQGKILHACRSCRRNSVLGQELKQTGWSSLLPCSTHEHPIPTCYTKDGICVRKEQAMSEGKRCESSQADCSSTLLAGWLFRGEHASSCPP